MARDGDPHSDDEIAFLTRLGERVREARARRGMSRKLLARDSRVSERYLAQLETGHGNVSILLLRQIAHAMGVPLVDLVREGPERPVELSLLLPYLSGLTPEQLTRARGLLEAAFGPVGGPAGAGRRERIALIGLRGAGKSTLGRRLAEARGVPFVELDREIERQAGMTLSEIFALYGQPTFRRWERRALDSVLESHPAVVIATGGSLVSEPGTFDLLLQACFTVWLKAQPEEHMARVVAQNDMRPMADSEGAMDDLRRILAGREPLYAKADVAVDTGGQDADASFAALCRAVEPAGA